MGYPLKMLSSEEIKVLYEIFKIKQDDTSETKLEKKLGNLLLPVNGIFQSGLTYDEMLQKIASKHKIKLKNGAKLADKERQLFLQLFSNSFNNLTPKDREEFLKELESNGLSKDQVASIVAITGVGVAQLSGIGVYLLATSAVGAISNALEITLSFATYTTMTSIIKYAIGPIGFILMAIPLTKIFWKVRSIKDVKDVFKSIFKEGKNLIKGNYEGAEIIFQYFAGLRIMKIYEIENARNEQLENINTIEQRSDSIKNEKEETKAKLISANMELEKLEEKINQVKLIREGLLKNELSLNRAEKDNLQSQAQAITKIEHINLKFESLQND